MKRTVIWVVLILVVFCAGVGYGLYSYEFEVFPFFEARRAYLFLTKPKQSGLPPGNWRGLEGGRTQSDETQQLIELEIIPFFVFVENLRRVKIYT